MVTCPKCNKENFNESKFCYNCGTDLRDIFSNSTNVNKPSDINNNCIKNKSDRNDQIIKNFKLNFMNIKWFFVHGAEINKDDLSNIFSKLKKNNLVKKLFYRKNKNKELVFSKTKTICLCIFLFLFSMIFPGISSSDNPFLVQLIANIICCLMVTAPFYILGIIIRKVINKFI